MISDTLNLCPAKNTEKKDRTPLDHMALCLTDENVKRLLLRLPAISHHSNKVRLN